MMVRLAHQPDMSKAGKRGVFPTHSAPIPGSFLFFVCVSSLDKLQKSFFPEKRQKEDTPFLFSLRGF
jgi:hypothetical protein